MNQALMSQSHLVILLHGYGGAGYMWKDMVPFLQSPGFIFTYPNGFETMRGGYMWYELYDNETGIDEDRLALDTEKNRAKLLTLVTQLATQHSIPLSHVILAGFSQGGMIALDLALHHDELNHAIVFGGMMPNPPHQHTLASQKKILFLHGIKDDIVPYTKAEEAHKFLENLGYHSTLLDRPLLGHSIDAIQLNQAKLWLEEHF